MTDKVSISNFSSLHATQRVRSLLSRNLRNTFNESDIRHKYISVNYDQRTYKDDAGNEYYPWLFSKLLQHDETYGFPLKSDVDKIIDIIRYGIDNVSDVEELLAQGSLRKLEGINASKSFQLIGTDSCVPSVELNSKCILRSDEFAMVYEMIEVYAMSILRDVAFSNYNNSTEVQEVINMLNNVQQSNIEFITAPLDRSGENPLITMKTLFRGNGKDELYGPYISQFLMLDFDYGNLHIEQKYQYMDKDDAKSRTLEGWKNIQEGKNVDTIINNQTARVFNARVLGAKVHNDPLFQFYYNAALIALQNNIKPEDYSNPISTSWTSGGPPSIFSNLAYVCEGALRVAWCNKYELNMRIRPEVYARRIDKIVTNPDNIDLKSIPGFKEIHDIVTLNTGISSMLSKIKNSDANENHLLSLQYPEGSPTHPSYPAGHACVAGAAVTVLKTMFKTHELEPSTGEYNKILWNDTISNRKAMEVVSEDQIGEYTEHDSSEMTIVGEFNKLASNISIGRNWAGVHYRSDGDCGMILGEDFAISFLVDVAASYHESHTGIFTGWILEKLNGEIIRITAEGVTNL